MRPLWPRGVRCGQAGNANERAIMSASVEDLKADMAARFEEVLGAVHARGGGDAVAGAAGVAPAPVYGGAGANGFSPDLGPRQSGHATPVQAPDCCRALVGVAAWPA